LKVINLLSRFLQSFSSPKRINFLKNKLNLFVSCCQNIMIFNNSCRTNYQQSIFCLTKCSRWEGGSRTKNKRRKWSFDCEACTINLLICYIIFKIFVYLILITIFLIRYYLLAKLAFPLGRFNYVWFERLRKRE